MAKAPALGRSRWIEEVFSSGPARNVNGKSRPTQRVLTREDQQSSVAEGGNTAGCRALLTAMRNAGLVKRFKLEPFALTKREHGIDAVPDAFFETTDGRKFVAENKACRFLTADKLEKQRLVENVVCGAGMGYVLWTDRWPFTPDTTRNLTEMRRWATSDIPFGEILDVAGRVASSDITIKDLREADVLRSRVFAAVWLGQVHMDLFSEVVDHSIVSSNSATRRFHEVLVSPVDAFGWWSSNTVAV